MQSISKHGGALRFVRFAAAGIASLGVMLGALAPTANAASARTPAPFTASDPLPAGYTVTHGSAVTRIPVTQALAAGVKGVDALAATSEACYTAHNWVKVTSSWGLLTDATYDRYWNWCSNLSTDKIIGVPTVRNTHAEHWGWTFQGADIQDGWYDPGSTGYYYRGFVNVHWSYIVKGFPVSHSSTLTDNIYSYGADVTSSHA